MLGVGVCEGAAVIVGDWAGASGVMKIGGCVGCGGCRLEGLSATIRLKLMLTTTITLITTDIIC